MSKCTFRFCQVSTLSMHFLRTKVGKYLDELIYRQLIFMNRDFIWRNTDGKLFKDLLWRVPCCSFSIPWTRSYPSAAFSSISWNRSWTWSWPVFLVFYSMSVSGWRSAPCSGSSHFLSKTQFPWSEYTQSGYKKWPKMAATARLWRHEATIVDNILHQNKFLLMQCVMINKTTALRMPSLYLYPKMYL